jgi:ubiquinone/menaquinone biosynthesis C-methylase UbiE
MQPKPSVGEYSLATGEAAVRRLTALHRVYSPAGRRILLRAGLKPGMVAADFGCGVGATTRTLAEMVGPAGSVTGVDVSAAQLEQGRNLCKSDGITNAIFVEASATATDLPRNSFDLVYCRYLLLHLVDPSACLREMMEILKPGGTLVVEDGDLTSAGSTPPSSLQWFADLFGRLGPTRGLDYALANRLYHLVKAAGFPEPDIEIHQPAIARGEERFLLKWTIEEAASAFIAAGLVTADEMDKILADMDRDTKDLSILPLAPRMSIVWARKPN